MSTLLVKVDTNWSDEMDITGFVVVGEEKWNKLMEMAKEKFPKCGVTVWVGTNEEIHFDNFEEFEHILDIRKIDVNQKQVLMDLFDGEYGFASILDNVLDACREDAEEDDD